ncbi:hypothetical protein SAMN04487846_2843 [Microbacterium sp. cf046]|uniref:hypothetical protein n=1 Tax=Microbacterium sp. cf046 TaxID=1761803 RepID=UPI0008EBB3CF|nr:hypothetical protein [Microbacterium sp. cf046]SFS14080.1 hypothetical protein SAMN04487846_2843 [Microbacterium sp. cf046]
MPSITTWSRLEPLPRRGDDTPGVAARIWDPLWLLGRQWQVGEFQGEDGGTPIIARWRGQVAPLSRYVLGPLPDGTQTSAPSLDLGLLPLEALVERQPVSVSDSEFTGLEGLRLAVEAGQHFLRVLAAQSTGTDYRAAFMSAFAVERPDPAAPAGSDAATLRYLDLVAGRALDGRRLRAELATRDLPDLNPPVDAADQAEVRAACADWLKWTAALFSHPTPTESQAWQRDRMEHAFSVAARLSDDPLDEYTLTAREYPGGDFDWYSVDRDARINLGTSPAEAGSIVTQTVIPAPLTVRGVPAPRFFEFEDGLLDLGALQPGPAELPMLLMLEAMSGYGNDWYLIPIDLPVGTITATRSLVVTDTFGIQTLLRPNGDPELADRAGFDMFVLATPQKDVDGRPLINALFLPPSIMQPLEGPALEEVLLARDETANLAWAIERRLASPLLEAVDGASDALNFPIEEKVSEDGEVPEYRLASSVPTGWIPLLPVRVDPESPEIRLARGAVLDLDGVRRVVTSRADLLGNPDSDLLIPEEEIPRSGAVVRRYFQAARDSDGHLYVWFTNRKSVGRGESSSGLRFDTLTED